MRSFLSALFCVAFVGSLVPFASAAASPMRAGHVEFEVLRGGQPFGRQGVTVVESPDGFVAETSADLSVQLGPIQVFRYRQSCREGWRAGQLVNLRCTTLKNGRTLNVLGSGDSSGLRITGAGGAISLPPGTWPTTWWTQPRLGSHVLVNTETGAELPVRVARVAREMISVGGENILAEHIRVSGTLTLDLWYDERGSWVGSSFSASGQHITYRLISSRSAAPA